MKNKLNKIVFAFALLIFACTNFAKAQTGTISFVVNQQPCNAGGVADGSLTATFTGFGSPIYIQYYLNSTYVYDTIFSGNTYTVNNWSGASFSIYGYDGVVWGQNFITSSPFDYTVNTTTAICPALGTATATITGGTGPFTVNWYDLGMTNLIATGNPASIPNGFYSVSITDNSTGCVFGSQWNNDSIYVANQSGLSGSVNVTPANCTNGSASVSVTGGITPYTYLWSNGANSATISNLTAGSYYVAVTDAQGCTDNFYGYVNQGININGNYTSSPATCLQYNGSAMAFATGGTAPYSFLWSNGQSGQSISNVQGGFYSFTITDAIGCIGNGWANIITSTPITATGSATSSQCTSATGSASINISGGTSPYSVGWNTFPAQTSLTATNLSAGSYGFTITDAVGCIRIGSIYVPPISTLNGSINTTSTPCLSAIGTASVNVTGTAAPFSYLWNTSATSSSINGLSAGGVTCQVTDANGCTKSFSGAVQTVSPINLGFSTTPASCIYTNDGSITAIATGGTAPYTYSWGSSTLNNIGDGNYWCTVTDANGCTKSGFSHVGYNATNNNCYCKIEGYAYEDLNTNCTQDVGENGINHVMVSCSGIGSTWTNANGYYSFIVPSGTYTISENPQGLINLAPCQSNNQVVIANASSGCVLTADFGNVISQVHDVRIFTMNWTLPVPGNQYIQSTITENAGTFTENNIQLGYAHDGQLSYVNSSPNVYSQQNPGALPNWYSITTGFPTLAAGQFENNYNYFNTPTNIPLGTQIVINDTVSYTAPISNWLNENTPWNNVEYYMPHVVGSYDPNFKEVFPAGQGVTGNIGLTDTLFRYVVHFQNTGTAPAQLVVVKDTLDANLDWSTLKPGWSSHNYVATMELNGVLTFRFDNINLPDSMSNPMGSMGAFEFTIEAKSTSVVSGVQIKNQADIYFDYNAPVITNTTINTYDNTVGIKSENKNESNLSVYPNPAGENIMLAFESEFNENTFVEVYDVSGKQIINNKFSTSVGKNFINLDLRSLSNGLYILKVKNSAGEKSKKISVAK